MSNPEDRSPRWMPVFVVHEAPRTVRAHPSGQEKGPPGEPIKSGEDVWQRVGTAFARANGHWDVMVNAVPLTGRFVLRPPAAGEEPTDLPLLWR